MNRNSSKNSLIIDRNLRGMYNAPVARLSSHRRIMSFSTTEDCGNNNSNSLDLFSRNRRSLSVASSDESDWQVTLDRLSVGLTKPAKSILDDLLSSNEGGHHDDDWLLTPPETQPKSVSQKRNSSVRSDSKNRTSRLSVSQSEIKHPAKPARSSSVTRTSISTTQNINKNSNILNTSSASISSYIRSSTPTNLPPSTARPTTASARTTPSRSRQSTINRTIRPSTSTTRPQSPTVQPSSHPSTPTHRKSTSLNNRIVGPTYKARLINHPDFPNETPPNLITSVPERPVSAGRSRPGAALTIFASGRVAEPPARGRLDLNGHAVESVTRKPIKVLNSENVSGFERSISKKSLNMAIRHLDIRTGSARPLSGSTRFPQSIRSSHSSSASNNVNSNNRNIKKSYSVKPVSIEHKTQCHSKLTRVDVYESLRYDSILQKEDLKNTSWLHNADEKSNQSPLFDHGFESLPEPFAPF